MHGSSLEWRNGELKQTCKYDNKAYYNLQKTNKQLFRMMCYTACTNRRNIEKEIKNNFEFMYEVMDNYYRCMPLFCCFMLLLKRMLDI